MDQLHGPEPFDFSLEADAFRGKLLARLRSAAALRELSEEELSLVNAAGDFEVPPPDPTNARKEDE